MELDKIGKYKILDKIGQGSTGVVYKAHDTILDRLVAIKTMSESLGADAEARRRFLREAQSAARLNHPNIVTVYDLGEVEGRVYTAMELLEGRNLGQLIGTPALATLDDKLKIMEEACDGLAFAHSKDVIHRDIKPVNIHVLGNGSVKVMDFGLARLGASDVTAKGPNMGTPNYMSPEQVLGQPTDARSDVFSLGSVFYEVLTHHKAFDADSLHAILTKVAECTPAPPRRWVADLPEILVRLLERAMARDPSRRFRNAGEMRLALVVVAQVLGGQLTQAEGLALLDLSDPEATAILQAPIAGAVTPPVGKADAPGREALTGGSNLSRGPTLPRRKTRSSGDTIPPSSRARDPSDTVPPRPVGAPAPSRWPLVMGAGVTLLLVAGGAFWFWPREQAAPSRDISKEQVGALKDALVSSQVDLAQESLKDKDYARAVAQAEQALKVDPDSAEARLVLDKAQAILKDLDAAADQARVAIQAGDTETAGRALSRVLAINPSHPVATELAAQLNRHFRGQAEEAQRALTAARAAAERGKAGSQPGFAQAREAAGAAERSFKSGEFAVATRKFLEGRDGFERALRLAEAAQAPRPPAATPTATVVASASATPPPTPVAVTPTPPPTVAATPAPTPVPAPTLRATSPAATAGDEAAVRRVIEEYGRAIQAKDLTLFRAVKPNLSAEEEKRLRTIFKQFKSYQVSISVASIQVEGAEARVRVSRHDTIDGAPFVLQQALTLVKGPEGWTIRDIASGQ